MNRLLRRQLRKLGIAERPPTEEEWRLFLERVSEAYTQNDQERYLRERAQSLADRELTSLADRLELARDEALAAARAKSEFLANMSHEIRTPLNGVLGLAALLESTELDSDQAEYVQGIGSCGVALLNVLNDVLDLSKLEAKKLQLEMIDFDYVRLTEDLLDVLGAAAREKGLAFVVTTDPAVPRWIRGDLVRVRQILLNLAGNAVKFTERGHVVVRTRVSEDGAMLVVSIEDSGIGIRADRIDALFQPFTQADASTTRRFGGTGLGLAICAELATQMKGDVHAESTEGVGSTFTVRLPLERGASPMQTSSLDVELRRSRVVVMDGAAVSRDALATLLTGWGLDVETAASEDEAFEIVTRARASGGPIDVVVTDRASGAEALVHRVRTESHNAELAFVLMRSPSAPAHDDRNYASVVHLPFKQTKLKRALAVALDDNASKTQAVPAVLATTPSRALTVLLVEDNKVNQKVATRMLERAGHDVTVADNGKIGLELATDAPFDVILMDCQMPVMDGFEASTRIRDTERNANTPIIALTANVMDRDRERCREAMMDAHVAKPVDPRALIDTIEACIADRARSASPQEA